MAASTVTKTAVDRHARALARFSASAEFFNKQRERELADLRFVDFDEQWPDDITAARAGQRANGGLPPVPARPCLTINQLRAPVQQVTNTARNAKLALQFSPKGDGADHEVAEAYEDIVRAIQADSRAHLARNWAFDRAAKCGLGWYRLNTKYVHDDPEADGPDADDQEIVYQRILNQASVYPDLHAQEPDWSDGKFLFLTQDLSLTEYQAQFPKSELGEADSDVLSAIGDEQPTWLFTAEGQDGRTVRIAEYWEVVETERKSPRGRVFTERRVFWSKINAVEVLEGPQEWNGQFIPIVPVIGEESNVNGERRWIGIVRPGIDAQRSYNYMRSAQVEGVGLAPRAPWILDPEQIEGYEAYWAQSNTRNFPYLPAKTVLRNGQPVPPPQRNAVEPAIQAITMAAHEAKDDIHATTGIPPVSLGQLDPHERSGKAIKALQGQAEVGSSGFLDNLATMSMMYEGKVIRDLIPRIYDRPGRIVPAVDIKDQRRQVMVNAPSVEQNGQPVQVPPTHPDAKVIDLKAGEYSVAVSVGKSYTTRRQETAAFLTELIGAVPPEMAAAIAPAMIEAQDSPDAKRIAEIAKNALPPALQKGYDDQGDGQGPQIPPEVEAQMAQLQQALQEAQQQLATDGVKTQGMLQKAQLDNQAKLQAAQLDNQTKLQMAERQSDMDADRELALQVMKNAAQIAVAHIAAASKGAALNAHAEEEQQALGLQAAEGQASRQHQAQMAERAHQQSLEQGQIGHQQALEQGQQGHEQTLEQTEQAAALEPEPVEGAAV